MLHNWSHMLAMDTPCCEEFNQHHTGLVDGCLIVHILKFLVMSFSLMYIYNISQKLKFKSMAYEQDLEIQRGVIYLWQGLGINSWTPLKRVRPAPCSCYDKRKKIMETLKLNFDATILGHDRELVVVVPYQGGVVATSEFCPTQLLAGDVDLMAAIRGESLDKFMEDCHRQLLAMSKITSEDAANELEVHIGGLMAVVMDHLSRQSTIKFGDLLIYIDCFSLLLKGAGFPAEEIRDIYPRVAKTITELYPDNIVNA